MKDKRRKVNAMTIVAAVGILLAITGCNMQVGNLSSPKAATTDSVNREGLYVFETPLMI